MAIVQSLSIIIAALVLFPTCLATNCPIDADVDVVIYGETGAGGVGDGSKSWESQFWEWFSSTNDFRYQFLTAADVRTCQLARYTNLKLYVQPGGNAYDEQRSLGQAAKANILGFLNERNDTRYLGTCAGWFYASPSYFWQGSYYAWPNMLGHFPLPTEGSIKDIADYPSYALTPLSDGVHSMIYYGGPTRGWRQTPRKLPNGASVLLNFTVGTAAGLPAVVLWDRMLLFSVHAEAVEEDHVEGSGLTTAVRLQNWRYRADSINKLTGQTWRIP